MNILSHWWRRPGVAGFSITERKFRGLRGRRLTIREWTLIVNMHTWSLVIGRGA